MTPDVRPSYKDDEPNTYMNNRTYWISLAAVAAVAAVVVYIAADHAFDVVEWMLELLDNPNF